MVYKVKAFTQAYSSCQHVHPLWQRLHGIIEPLPQPHGPRTDISVDFIVSLPVSRWKNHTKPHNALPIVVDWYIEQVPHFPCHNTPDTVGLTKIFTSTLRLRSASIPQSVISGCQPQFTSRFWTAFCHHMYINRYLNTVYKLQTDR